MGATTVYDVRLRYMMDDKTRGPRVGLNSGLREVSKTSTVLEGSLARLKVLAVGAFGFVAARKALIEYNSSIEQAKITTAGMMELNVGGGFAANMQRANFLVERLQQEAKTSIGTTKDMVDMLSMVTQPLTAAGASMSDLVDITKGAVVAARAMGIAAPVAARDIDQAIRGQFHAVDQLTSKLLGPAGFFGEEGRRRFNAMTMQARMAAVKTALTSPALKEMAKAQGTSWEGAFSTLEDNIQITLGKVGLPLFRAITAELNNWNGWLDKNSAQVESMVHSLSTGLADGFRYVKTVFEFIVAHKDLFLGLATAWGGLKLAGMGVGGIANLSGSFGGVAEATGKASVGLADMATKLTAVTQGLTAVALAATALAAWINESQSNRINNASLASGTLPAVIKNLEVARAAASSGANFGGDDVLGKKGLVKEDLGAVNAIRSLATQLYSVGLAGDGHIYETKVAAALAASPEMQTKFAERLGVAPSILNAQGSDEAKGEYLAKLFGSAVSKVLEVYSKMPARAMPDIGKPGTDAGKSAKPPIVHIHRIEVASDDPDRFVFELSKVIRDATKNTSQAHDTHREGG